MLDALLGIFASSAKDAACHTSSSQPAAAQQRWQQRRATAARSAADSTPGGQDRALREHPHGPAFVASCA